jgi:membrane-bound metal-dependent hydrolase YbcI (DUF457 family)
LDNLTHTLFAVTLARTPLARAGRGTTAALVLASNAPDIDIVTVAAGPVSYLRWHRGPTHGPIGVVVLGLVTAALVWFGRRIYDQRQARKTDTRTTVEGDATFAMLAAVSMIGIVLHILMDLPTSYGTRLLSPFDWHWFGIDLMPIIDLYLLAALIAGILFGQQSPAARRRNASIILALMAANYGVRAVSHRVALGFVPRLFGPTLPQPCNPNGVGDSPIDVWPRAAPQTPPPGSPRCLIEAAAMPSFTSPFQWRIVLKLSNAYELRDIDLLDSRWRDPDEDTVAPWRTTVRYPNVWTPIVTQAADTRLGRVFLGFSRFPAARSALDAHGSTTVRWTDVRFAAGLISLEQPRSGPDIFTAVVRIDRDGRVVEERLGR